MNSVNILGIDINCISRDGILESILTWTSETKRRNIFYANAHNLNIASVNADYFAVLNQADLVYPDGFSIVWASNLLGGCKLEKLSLIHWIDKLFEFIIQNNLRIYIIAGKPEIIPKAIKTILYTHPKIKITGYSSGFLTRKNQQTVFDEINSISPDILFVGMGSPNQEIWINNNREMISPRICWAVGALFDYIAGEERITPGWLNNLGLEWLWRFSMDPKGKWKRYLVGNPAFIYRIIKQKFVIK